MGSDVADYDLQRYGRTTDAEKGVSMSYAFEKHDWDYVILQGATHKNIYDNVLWDDTFTRTDGGVTTTYNSAEMLGDFKEYAEEKAPNATRFFVAPWAPYESLSATFNNKTFANAKPDARGAYTAGILEKSKQKAAVYATDGMYLPTAVAIDYLIRYYGFDETQGAGVVDSVDSSKIIYDNKSTTTSVYRDSTCHLTNSVGRVLAGLVWYEMITGNSALENDYSNSLPEDTMNKIKAAAHYACQNYASYNPANI